MSFFDRYGQRSSPLPPPKPKPRPGSTRATTSGAAPAASAPVGDAPKWTAQPTPWLIEPLRAPGSERQFIGIDPGRGGGFVALDGESRLLHAARLPWRGSGRAATLDVSQILVWLSGVDLDAWRAEGQWDPIVAIERPTSRPREETAVARRVGEQLGALLATCELHRVPVVLVSAGDWSPWALRHEPVQARARKGRRDEDADQRRARRATERKARKGAHLVVAKRRWPELELGASEDGIADAALIAEYSRLRHLAQVGFSTSEED